MLTRENFIIPHLQIWAWVGETIVRNNSSDNDDNNNNNNNNNNNDDDDTHRGISSLDTR